MRISVVDYQGFKNVVTALGTPTHVFYSTLTSGEVQSIVAIAPHKDYVQYDNSTGETLLPTTVTTDYPAAVSALTSVQSAY